MARLHDVFHVSVLRKYIQDEAHVLTIPEVHIDEDLTFREEPVQILDRTEKRLRGKSVVLVKVLWRSNRYEEQTWEPEEKMKEKYPHLFQ